MESTTRHTNAHLEFFFLNVANQEEPPNHNLVVVMEISPLEDDKNVIDFDLVEDIRGSSHSLRMNKSLHH